MNSPALAIGWDFFSRQRRLLVAGALLLLLGSALIRWETPRAGGSDRAAFLAYALTALLLTLTFGSLHFTEGTRQGGFGGFPARLFHLPVRTPWLVAVPMVAAAAAIAVVYLGCTFLLLYPLGRRPPLLWPSLYLIAGVVHFQSIVWALHSRPRWRLLCLGAGAAILASTWMFFLPDIYAGTLSDWGYSGDPEVFMAGLHFVLALAAPLAFLIGWNRIHAQRHRRSTRNAHPALPTTRRIAIGLARARARAPFRSADRALLWHEFRRTGWVLPGAVLVLLAMTGIPTALQGDERGRVTAGVLTAMALAPVVLAMIIGRGLARPDFWSDATRWSSFYSVLPATPGMWVRSKLTAALLGAAATWILTVGTACLWLIGFGDFALLDSWWYGIRVYYSPEERLLLSVLLPIAATLLTWRCLIAGLADGMSGIPWLRRAADTLTAAVVIAFFVWILRGGDDETSQSPFQVLQPWAWTPFLPALLAALVAAKMVAASIAWTRVHARRLLSARAIATLWLAWLLGVAFLGATTLVLCGSVLWLRYLLFLAAILGLPLARIGIAILALHRNRSHP